MDAQGSIPCRDEAFFFAPLRPDRPTQLPILVGTGALSPRLKRLGREAHHSLSSRAEVELYLHSPHTSWRGAYQHGNNFAFILQCIHVTQVNTKRDLLRIQICGFEGATRNDTLSCTVLLPGIIQALGKGGGAPWIHNVMPVRQPFSKIFLATSVASRMTSACKPGPHTSRKTVFINIISVKLSTTVCCLFYYFSFTILSQHHASKSINVFCTASYVVKFILQQRHYVYYVIKHALNIPFLI